MISTFEYQGGLDGSKMHGYLRYGFYMEPTVVEASGHQFEWVHHLSKHGKKR